MQKIIVVAHDEELADRVSRAMEKDATCIHVDPTSPTANAVIERIGPDMLVVEASTTYAGAGSANFDRIAALRERYPEVPLVALGDELAAQSVLMVMRAGAGDLIERDSSASELRAQLSAHLKQKLRKRGSASEARVFIVLSGRPDENEAHLAVNVAVQKALHGKDRRDVVLVDLNLPCSEAAVCLDLKPTYTFREALDDLLRLDKTLVTSALARHEPSGLYLLPLSTGAEDVRDLRPADMLSIIFMLRSMFQEVVISVGYLRRNQLLAQLVEAAGTVAVLASQHFASIKAASDLFKSRDLSDLVDDRFHLVIAEYDDRIEIKPERIAEVLGIRKVHVLPVARAELINGFNSGRVLSVTHPRSPYCRAIEPLVFSEPVLERPKRAAGPVARFLAKVGL